MKTDALIRSLALDAARPVVPLNWLVASAFAMGGAASVALFLAGMRLRPDFAAALSSAGFLLKVATMAALAATGATLLVKVGRPIPRTASLKRLAVAPLLLLAAVAVELVVLPADAWHARLIGRNAPHCLALIPFLSVAPAASLMWALRCAAPARPGLAGAIVGLTAGGIGASLYALSCPDDSALFVATWYSFAIAFVTGACFI